MVSHRLLVLAGLPMVALASFVPLPMHHFAENPEQKGTRRFSHSEHHLLEGGSALSLSWHADADPDSIMALDTEHKAGVRLVSCTPTQLVLHLPASHVSLAKAWKHVTASEELHGCPHLADHPLYHRIENMEFTKHQDTPKGGKTLVLTTKELYQIADVLPNVAFDYAVTPIESLHPDLQAEARRFYEEQKKLPAGSQQQGEDELSARRLQAVNWTSAMKDFSTSLGNPHSLDQFKTGFKKSIGQVEITNSFDNKEAPANAFKPMTHANFGWNWNYHTNTTRNPQFKFTLPGMRGYVLLKNPYLKFLGSMKIQFKSHWDDLNPFAAPPRVQLNAAFEGNAFVNADLSLMANVYRDVSEDPFGRFNIPILNNFTKETHYYKKVNFFIANIPISLQPGVSVNLDAYHLGLFKGAVRLGVNVQLHVSASAVYDSLADLKMNFEASAVNVKILPPTWMIYTKHLEFGALLNPSFWIKGGFGPVRGVTLELQLKPYCNVSVTQLGQSTYGVQQQVMEKELLIVPFRAINLPIGSEWSVGIEANGRKKQTSVEMSLGVVEFTDYVEHFRFGLIDQRRLMREPINVCLFKDGVQQQGKIVSIYCESVVDGECQPAPFNVEFLVDGQTVIVQLTMAWHAQPVPFLMSKVRSMSIVFPQLALSAEASKTYNANPPDSVLIKITRNGREYSAIPTVKVVNTETVMMETKQVQDLGVAWIDAWRIRYGSIDGSSPSYSSGGRPSITDLIDPSVELFFVRNGQAQVVAQAFLPSVHWNEVLDSTADGGWLGGSDGVGESGAGAFGGLFGGVQGTPDVQQQKVMFAPNPAEVYKETEVVPPPRRLVQAAEEYAPKGSLMGNVPLTIVLNAVNTEATFATGNMGMDVHNPARSSRWLRPYHTEKFVQGSEHKLFWATRGASPSTPQNFQFVAFKVEPNTGVYTPTSMSMSLTGQVCSQTDDAAKNYMGYGSECVFSQALKVDAGLVGITVVFQLVFTDNVDGTIHKMMSAPVSFISQAAAAPAELEASRKAVVSWPTDARKLSEEGGNMVAAPENSDKEVEINMESFAVIRDDEEKPKEHKESKLSRRLGAKARILGEQYGYSPSNIDFGQRMSELHPICTRQPLHYEIGAGIFFRAKLHNLHIPEDANLGALTPLASMANMANLDTMDIPLANTVLGKKLSDLFPKDLCAEGVCDGTLPGCPGQNVKSMLVPKVEFTMNRDFKWDEETQKKAKDAVAYGMALVPEVIRVTSIVIASLLHSTTREPGTGDGGFNTGNVVYSDGKPCRWTKRPDCVDQFNYRGTNYYGCSTQDHKKQGWCSVDQAFVGNWRDCDLSCRNEAGQVYIVQNVTAASLTATATARKLSDAPESNRFVVEFSPEALQYNVDDDLIQHLIRRKAFRGMEDGREADLGVAEITGFRVHKGDTEVGKAEMIPVGPEEKFEVHSEGKFGVHFTGKAPAIQAPFLSAFNMPFVAGVALLAVASLVTGFTRVLKSRQVLPYEVMEENQQPVE